MKNWKFIKVGNDATGPNWDKKRQLEDELRGWMTTASKATGEEKQNAEKQISEIRKELNDVKIKIAHGENKKAWNESIEKQELSMFKGLSKDAEKFGNADTVSEYNAEIQRLTKKAEQLRRMGQGRSAMEIEKQIEKLGKEIRELGNKKIGNGLIRARNAIKTKNADITLWNGNDSAYIKEDGHVQYLENNSFVVDEDKYDSQEKAVEELTKKGYRKK